MTVLRDQLLDWFAGQDPWQRDLARRLADRPQLIDADYEDALRVVRQAFDALDPGEVAAAPEPLAREHLADTAVTGATRLVGLGQLEGVGAVCSQQTLRFAAEGLTIVYGQNAAGKTSYVRVLKRVCRTVDRDAEVRGNVFSTGGANPSAEVSLLASGVERTQRVDLTERPALDLDALSVFDASCAELYVDEENAIAFVPSELRLLARLAATQDRMRTDLEARIAALRRSAPDFSEFPPGNRVRELLDGLSRTTPVGEIRALGTLLPSEMERQTQLRAAVAAAEARTTQGDAEAARHDGQQAHALAAQLQKLAGTVTEPAWSRVNDLAGAAMQAEASVRLAAAEFSHLPIAGVGDAAWRRLWEAARAFSTSAQVGFPPDTSGSCPVCLQGIGDAAEDRLSRFEAFVQSSLQTVATTAQAALGEALAELDPGHSTACRTPFLTGLADREQSLYTDVERYVAALEGRRLQLRLNPGCEFPGDLVFDAIDSLTKWGDERIAHAATLFALADPMNDEALRKELIDLDARQSLGVRLSEVEVWVRSLGAIAALRQAHSALATNRLTTLQRQLSEQVLTGALESSLKDELRSMRCDHLPVNLHPQTRVGSTRVSLRLAGAGASPRISQVASEGEQRALSLSFFFAEVALSEGDGGIVVDDPVSSLDDERREYIARRLLEESERRQVIVFTHDLPFMLELMEMAETAGQEPVIRGLWRVGQDVGRVDDDPPFKAMKIKGRLGVLKQEVARWDNQSPPGNFDEAWDRVCSFYARMRTAWERAVEEKLFAGVVQRFQREVKTQSLASVNITAELVEMVDKGMSRCSAFVHDAPSAMRAPLPGRSDLEADLQRLEEFVRLASR